MFLPLLLSYLTPGDTGTPGLGVGPRHQRQPRLPPQAPGFPLRATPQAGISRVRAKQGPGPRAPASSSAQEGSSVTCPTHTLPRGWGQIPES